MMKELNHPHPSIKTKQNKKKTDDFETKKRGVC